MRVLRFIPLVSVALALAACEQPLTSPDTSIDAPNLRAVHFKTNLKVPLAQFVVIPCVPEFIILQGTLHILFQTTIDNGGGFHTKFHFQPQGATGTGSVTNDTYHGVGVTQQTLNVSGDGLPFEFTFVNNFRMIGTGKGAVSFHVHQTVHVTVNSNGNVTAQVGNTRITCG